MNTITGEALLLKFKARSDGAAVAGMVATADGILTVGGTVGTIPAAVAWKLVHLARQAGVDVRRVGGGKVSIVMALSFGEIDWDTLYPIIVDGIAQSQVQAIVSVLNDHQIDVDETGENGDGESLPF
jgi:hypothetical protein